MKYFLLCLVAGLHIGVFAQSIPSLSELAITGEEAVRTGQMTASIEGRSYNCSGGVLPSKFSVLACGEQRQAQAEFQSFASETMGLLAFYESGRQSGALFLFQKSASGFVQTSAPIVFTPGFGSLKQFQKYVLEPMAKDIPDETKLFEILPKLMEEVGSNMTLSQLRDRVANKEHRKWLPKPVKPVEPTPAPQPEVTAPVEKAPVLDPVPAEDLLPIEEPMPVDESAPEEEAPPAETAPAQPPSGGSIVHVEPPVGESDSVIHLEETIEAPKVEPAPKKQKPKKPRPAPKFEADEDWINDPLGSDADIEIP